jgi:4-hydroxybenzoate polyprenyltransferase
MPLSERIHRYALLMRLHRPIGIYLLLWPTLWALWLASQGRPDPLVLLVFVAGVVLMRSAGCVINDYADRHIDPHVRRTRDRPLAAGQVGEKEALWLFVGLCLSAFALVLSMNRLTILLSLPALALAVFYPFSKRYTYLPQAVLGAAFSWAIPMVFAAQTGSVPDLAWWVFLTALLWTIAYDTLYAMVDREDDLLIGVKSSAILFGRADRLVVGLLQLAVLGLLGLIGILAGLGWVYYLGLAVAAGLAAYQQYLIRGREARRCFQAFLDNHWFGATVFCGIAGDFLLSIRG